MVESLDDTTGGDRKPTGGGDPIHGPKKEEKKAAAAASQEWKVCKGCLYYSSRLRSRGRGPPCIGTEIPLPRVPASMREQYKAVATREGNLSFFKYTCVGYSIFSHGEDSPTKEQNKPASLPVCVGYELLLGKKSTPSQSSTPSQAPARGQYKHRKEDLYFLRSRTTSHELARANFVGRFSRNAGVVASGVARNLLRVGTYIKDNLDSMLYPDGRRPK